MIDCGMGELGGGGIVLVKGDDVCVNGSEAEEVERMKRMKKIS